MARHIRPTNREVFFSADDIIVSKTDIKGRITYANHVFLTVSGFSEEELLGQQHSIVRHPDMPRAVFKLLWDTLLQGREIFAYIKNIAKSGDHYWVFAHVTPSFDKDGQINGFHSNRRVPARSSIDAILPLYAELLRAEAMHRNAKDGLAVSSRRLIEFVESKEKSYEELVLSF